MTRHLPILTAAALPLLASAAVLAQTAPAPQNTPVAAEAATHHREAPPAPAPARPFQLKPRTTYTLPNGLVVNLLQYGNVPKVAISVEVNASAVDLKPEQTGLDDLTAYLMLEGTTSRSGVQIAQEAADMGSSIGANSGTYSSNFSMDVLSGSAPSAIALLADIVQHPSFPAADFERLRGNLHRTVATSLANPGFLAQKKYAELMWGTQPSGRTLPTDEQINSFSVSDVKNYYTTNFGAARTRIYVVGNFDEAAVRSAIQTAFGGWTKGPAVFKPKQTPHTGRQFALVPQPGAAQSNIVYGLPVPGVESPGHFSFFVMDQLLGGSFGSRITSNIRETHGYTYSPHSSVSNSYKAATWQESAALTTASTGPALTEIDNEIHRLQNEAPTAAEVTAIQRYADGNFVLQNSTRNGILGLLSFVDFHELPDSYLTNYTRNVDAVTPAQVQASSKLIDPNSMTLVVVGDPAVVTPQLKDFSTP